MTTRQAWPRRHESSAGTDGRLVYAVGDVHGRYDLLKAMFSLIADDVVARGDGRRPMLIMCGDYVDRGPQSAEVVSALQWMERDRRFEFHPLRGNHEQALLDFVDRPERGRGWLRFGGDATLLSYGVEPPADPDDADALTAARDALLERLPVAHLQLLQRLELMIVVGDYVFVHAGVRPDVPLARQNPDDLLWIRNGFLECTRPFEKRVVHGHSWMDAEPELLDNRLGLDTGAYETGILTAARIEDGSVEILQTQR